MMWKNCRTNPPPEYHRVEIKDKQNNRYIGYKCGSEWFETYGNYLIKKPMYWREPPEGSTLLAELKEKLRITGGETVFDMLGE